MRGIEFRNCTWRGDLYWKRFSIVAINSVYIPSPFRCLSIILVFWSRNLQSEKLLIITKNGSFGLCPYFFGLLRCIGNSLTRLGVQSFWVHVHWLCPLRDDVFLALRQFVWPRVWLMLSLRHVHFDFFNAVSNLSRILLVVSGNGTAFDVDWKLPRMKRSMWVPYWPQVLVRGRITPGYTSLKKVCVTGCDCPLLIKVFVPPHL